MASGGLTSIRWCRGLVRHAEHHAVELRHLIGDPGRDPASTSYGTRVQSAVIASSEETGRSTIGWP